jgi:hypothetical protein
MLIRIRRRDYENPKTLMVEPEGIIAATWTESTACYKGQKPVFRILYGLFKSLLAATRRRP